MLSHLTQNAKLSIGRLQSKAGVVVPFVPNVPSDFDNCASVFVCIFKFVTSYTITSDK